MNYKLLPAITKNICIFFFLFFFLGNRHVFFEQSQILPGLSQKSQPAHCQSAGTGIFGWLALPWVGRDLQNKRLDKNCPVPLNWETDSASVYQWEVLDMWQSSRGLPSIRSQSLCRSCMGQASHSWISVLLLCKAAAVVKACFRVSITSSTWHIQSQHREVYRY